MDYGKYKYEQSKRAKEAKKHQHTVVVKEMKFRPKTEEHDYQFKLKHVRKFLDEGNKAKMTVRFRGREMAQIDFGRKILEQIATRLEFPEQAGYSIDNEGRARHIIVAEQSQAKVWQTWPG